MLREIKIKLGFDLIELDHGIRMPLMPGIQKMFDAGEIRFSSLHNFCLVPAEATPGSSACHKFSAASAEERERAVTQTFQAIDLAGQLKAPFVVLRLGEISMPQVTNRLIAMAKSGEYLSRKYVREKIKAVQQREREAPKYMQHVRSCLRRVSEYAGSKNVRLAIENRPAYEQIPTEREVVELLDEMNSAQVGYWHDFGHSQIKENLGFIDHAEWLRAIGPRTFGCHVQDCVWPARGDQLPFSGGIDFEKLVPLLGTNCLFVWKMNPNRTADAICQSVQMWKQRFGE
ncbi:MAG: hypothetical protein DME65_02965 [Verrucomicrobia bacterium]|nr:MAG: hypothetical protein DME65_02965 [Verrucomicrobiota bacterium]